MIPYVEHPTGFVEPGKSVLVRNTLYFVLLMPFEDNRILEYDLGRHEPPVMTNIPSAALMIDLITTEDGGLGFIYVQEFKLYLWSRVIGMNKWVQHRVWDLTTLLPVCALTTSPKVVVVADDAGLVFIETTRDIGVFAINLKLGQATKVGVCHTLYGTIVPYVSFYTHVLDYPSEFLNTNISSVRMLSNNIKFRYVFSFQIFWSPSSHSNKVWLLHGRHVSDKIILRISLAISSRVLIPVNIRNKYLMRTNRFLSAN
jgi:hypothetical protein